MAAVSPDQEQGLLRSPPGEPATKPAALTLDALIPKTPSEWLALAGAVCAFASTIFLGMMTLNLYSNPYWWPWLAGLNLLSSGFMLSADRELYGAPLIAIVIVLLLIPFTFNPVVVWWYWGLNGFGAIAALYLFLSWLMSGRGSATLRAGVWCLTCSLCILVLLLVGLLFIGGLIIRLQPMIPKLYAHSHSKNLSLPVGVSVSYCSLGDPASGGCRLSNFSAGPSHVYNIYTGGDTQCLDGSQYFFQVIKGDPRKVVFYYQGGGACWDFAIYTAHQCTRNVYDTIMSPCCANETFGGIFDLWDSKNPYKDYTQIKLSYCGGDIFAGDTSQFWVNPGATERPWKYQKGAKQAEVVLNWLRAQFHGDEPGLKRLSSLLIAGSSAGSLGLQWNSNHVLKTLEGNYDPAGVKVIGDSFIGVLPHIEAENNLFVTWNMCNTGVLSDALQAACHAGELTMDRVYSTAMQTFPDVRFGNIQSKYDEVQISFANAFEATYGLSVIFSNPSYIADTFTPETFYKKTNMLIANYSKIPNYRAYFVSSNQHTYLELGIVYTATPVSPTDNCDVRDAGQRMTRWISEPSKRMQYQCYDTEANVPAFSARWCDSSLPFRQLPCA